MIKGIEQYLTLSNGIIAAAVYIFWPKIQQFLSKQSTAVTERTIQVAEQPAVSVVSQFDVDSLLSRLAEVASREKSQELMNLVNDFQSKIRKVNTVS